MDRQKRFINMIHATPCPVFPSPVFRGTIFSTVVFLESDVSHRPCERAGISAQKVRDGKKKEESGAVVDSEDACRPSSPRT